MIKGVISKIKGVKLPAHRAGLPGHTVASRMRAKEISFLIVPLDPLGPSTHWIPQLIGPLNPLGPSNPAYNGACGALAGHMDGRQGENLFLYLNQILESDVQAQNSDNSPPLISNRA